MFIRPNSRQAKTTTRSIGKVSAISTVSVPRRVGFSERERCLEDLIITALDRLGIRLKFESLRQHDRQIGGDFAKRRVETRLIRGHEEFSAGDLGDS